MPAIVLYFLKVSVSLAIVWVFYQLLLRRLTFYTLNRWYLLGYSVLAFFIPLIDLGPVLDRGGETSMVQLIPSIGAYGIRSAAAKGWMEGFGIWNWLVVGMIAGTTVLLVRLVVRWTSLYKIRRGARLVRDGGFKVYQVEEAIRPFSFGDAIYINPRLHTEKEWSEIILHEYEHIRGRHSFDVLFSEVLCILNWYNPFVWLIRYSVRQNLEFIADRTVLENGVDKRGYQYHLLKVVGDHEYRLANNFNFSSLKKRIIMMNKIRSARLHLLKFLFILPLMGVLLVAFRNQVMARQQGPAIPAKAEVLGVKEMKVDGTVAAVTPVKVVSDGKEKVIGPVKVGKVPVMSVAAGPVAVQADTTAPLPANVLYVIDGEVQTSAPLSLDASKIASIDVIKGEQALRLFGEKGKYGVVAILTKAFKENHPIPDEKDGPIKVKRDPVKVEDKKVVKDPVVKYGVIVKDSSTNVPLYIVDGVEMTNGLRDINPDNIESISVIKDAAAKAIYGEKGRNGVIIIQLKKKSAGDAKPVSNRGGIGKDGYMKGVEKDDHATTDVSSICHKSGKIF